MFIAKRKELAIAVCIVVGPKNSTVRATFFVCDSFYHQATRVTICGKPERVLPWRIPQWDSDKADKAQCKSCTKFTAHHGSTVATDDTHLLHCHMPRSCIQQHETTQAFKVEDGLIPQSCQVPQNLVLSQHREDIMMTPLATLSLCSDDHVSRLVMPDKGCHSILQVLDGAGIYTLKNKSNIILRCTPLR